MKCSYVRINRPLRRKALPLNCPAALFGGCERKRSARRQCQIELGSDKRFSLAKDPARGDHARACQRAGGDQPTPRLLFAPRLVKPRPLHPSSPLLATSSHTGSEAPALLTLHFSPPLRRRVVQTPQDVVQKLQQRFAPVFVLSKTANVVIIGSVTIGQSFGLPEHLDQLTWKNQIAQPELR